MSILTGQPAGRVVITQHRRELSERVDKVTVIRRELVELVEIDHAAAQHPILGYTLTGDIDCGLNIVDDGYAMRRDVPSDHLVQTTFDIFDSLVAEDCDVIWTQQESGYWTRVPDRADPKENK